MSVCPLILGLIVAQALMPIPPFGLRAKTFSNDAPLTRCHRCFQVVGSTFTTQHVQVSTLEALQVLPGFGAVLEACVGVKKGHDVFYFLPENDISDHSDD